MREYIIATLETCRRKEVTVIGIDPRAAVPANEAEHSVIPRPVFDLDGSRAVALRKSELHSEALGEAKARES